MSLRKIASSLLLGAAALAVAPTGSEYPFLSYGYAQDLQSVESQFARAAGLYAQGDWSGSARAFEQFLADHPSTRQASGARFFLGEALVQQNNFEDALLAYQQFIAENPNHEYMPRATFRLGEAQLQAGQENKAVRTWEHFAKSWPENELVEFALPYLGEIRLKRGEPQLARATFMMAIKLFPEGRLSNRSQFGLAKAQQRLGEFDKAREHFGNVIQQAVLAKKVDQPSSADLIQEMVAQSHLQVGVISFAQGDYDVAADALTQAMELTAGPDKVESVYWMARTEIARGNEEAGVELVSSLVAAAEEQPMDESIGAIALFDGAIAAAKVQREELACIWLGKLRTIYPENPLADDAFMVEIDLHHKGGRLNKVTEMFESLVASEVSRDVLEHAAETAGRTYYQLGQYETSVATFAELLRTEPHEDDPLELQQVYGTRLYLQSLGLLRLALFEEADVALEKAASLNPNKDTQSRISMAHATALFSQEQFDRAAQHYRDFLSAVPTGSDAVRAACEMTVCYARQKQWKEMLDGFELIRSAKENPCVAQTTLYIAQLADAAKEWPTAEMLYRSLIQPGQADQFQKKGLAGLAVGLIESEDSGDTRSIFERYVETAEDREVALQVVMSRAEFLDAQQKSAAAVDFYSTVASQFPESDSAIKARLRCAYLLQTMGGNSRLKRARDLLKEQLQHPVAPGATDAALYQLGWVMAELGEQKSAQSRFNRLLEQFPESVYWPEIAFDQVIEKIKKSDSDNLRVQIAQVAEHPHVSDDLKGRAMMLQCQQAVAEKDWPAVTELTEQMAQFSADDQPNSKATYWLAESLYQQSKFQKAGDAFATIDGVGAEQLQPWVRLRMAQCRAKNKQWLEASEIAASGKTEFVDFEKTYEYDFIIARSLEAQGLFDEALKQYQAVMAADQGIGSETSTIAQWRIGEIHFHRESYPDAIKAYAKVNGQTQFRQWRTRAILQAGKCQEHLGNWKHASTLYSQLIGQFPETEMAAQAKQRLGLVERQAQKITEEKRR